MAEETDGIVRVSLVDFPAVERDFMAFAQEKPAPAPVVADNDAHLIHGVIMRANYPIYRSDANVGGYWIVYRPEVLRAMAEKYIAENRANAVDLNHDGEEVGGVQLVQLYIKDTAKGINPRGFEDVEDGSIFGEFHVTNADVWAAIKAGTYRGFSIEVFNEVVPSNGVHSTEKIADVIAWLETKLNKDMSIKTKLAKMLARFGATTTNKGVIHWEGDADLVEGVEVWAEDENGERVELEDGDYMTEDGKIIVVVGGKVAEIKDNEAEVAPEGGEEMAEEDEIAETVAEVETIAEDVAEETAEEVAEEVAEDVANDVIDELRGIIDALTSRVADLEANVAALVEVVDNATNDAEFKTARERYNAKKGEVKKEEAEDKFSAALSRAKAVAAALR